MPLRQILCCLLASTSVFAATSAPQYPAAPRGEVQDNYHGTSVADPYRWMEAQDSPQVRGWVAAQNDLARPRLESLPQRAWFKKRLTQLWNYERFAVPTEAGGNYFWLRNSGTQDQAVLYVGESLADPGRVLFDPNGASSDATVALSRFEPSADGKLLAYALSDGGTDWETWHFRRVADGTDLPDVLRFTKFGSLSFAKDGSGVWYTRYPRRQDSQEMVRGDDLAQSTIYFHRFGESQDTDQLAYAVSDHPTRTPDAQITDDGRYLILGIFDGYQTNGVRLMDLRDPARPVRDLFYDWDAQYTVIGTRGDEFFVLTTQSAPNGRVFAVDVNKPDRSHWRPVVPESTLAIEAAQYVGGRIIVRYVRDAIGVAKVFETNGALAGEVPVPGPGTLSGFDGHGERAETFFSFADFLQPPRIFRLDVATLTVAPWRAAKSVADVKRFETVQRFYTSKDGTRIPMFITQRRGLKRDGKNPVLLYGYGGFSVAITPTYKPPIIAWLEMGGVYVEANLRGGSEYGERWHEAGTKERKQNVFDDFIAAAEFLIAEKYTRAGRIAISGRSNGGLLVGATMVQKPELFGAALPAVGVLDMLRYHTASANARQWSSDFGLSENPAEFAAQLRYSPVHNTRAGVCYPPTLITTADRDDRVVPWHSYKFAASLQRDQGCAKPVFIRVETRAGHGAGKPVWMQIEDYADQYGFAADALGVRKPR